MGNPAKSEFEEDDYGITVELGLPFQPEDKVPVDVKEGQVLLGRYRIEARLGNGGMGTVYRAEDRVRSEHAHIDGAVALKIVHAGKDMPASALDKLRHEFYCAQALSHPSIVKVFELEGSDDVAFFTMEYLDGEPLSEVMKRSPKGLPRPHAWSLIRDIGEGLAHAHSRNVVHADLKPQNVMLLKGGGLRILDFGTASLQAVGNGSSAFTPSYASCQLLEGKEADERDDVFALACLAYELLTGEHPFQKRRATEARDAGMTAKEPKNLSQGQWQALQRGLAWASDDRPNSVQDWVTELVLSSAPRWKASPAEAGAWESAPKLRVGILVWVGAAAVLLAVAISGAVIHARSSKATVAVASAVPATADVQPKPLPTDEDLKEQESKMADIEPQSAGPAVAVPKVHRAAVARPTGPVIEKIAFAEKALSLDPRAKFAEIHVFRSATKGEKTSFVWWTEGGSASPGTDFVEQGRTSAYFPAHDRMTTLFVKIPTNATRKKPQTFFLNIAEASDGAAIGATSRLAITLLPRGA